MGNMKTPPELADKGYLIMDADESTGTAGICIPLNMSDNSLTGTLRILVDTIEDLKLIKDVFRDNVPQAAADGAYSIKVEIYESSEDELHHLRGRFSIEALLTAAGLMDQEDVEMEWD